MENPRIHHYRKQPDGAWKCWMCGDTAPPSESAPCAECGARTGEQCRLEYCRLTREPEDVL